MQHPISVVLLTTSLLLLLSLGNAQNINVLTGEYQPSGAPPAYPGNMGSGHYPGAGSMGSGAYPYPGSSGSGGGHESDKDKTCSRIADEWDEVRDRVMSLRTNDDKLNMLYQEIQRINEEFRKLWEVGE